MSHLPTHYVIHASSTGVLLQVFATIGHWASSVYLILALHAVPVWVFSSAIRLQHRGAPPPHLAWLVSCPPALMLLTSIGILIPSLGIFVEVRLSDSIFASELCNECPTN